MYCAQFRSKDNVDEIGQLTEEQKTRKEISLSILRSIWCWKWDDRSKEIKSRKEKYHSPCGRMLDDIGIE